ncbi:MAG: sigma 54-interacting transcriptional regulator, partial [Hyphomicrobium sp.]
EADREKLLDLASVVFVGRGALEGIGLRVAAVAEPEAHRGIQGDLLEECAVVAERAVYEQIVIPDLCLQVEIEVILLADDDASLRFVLAQALTKEGYAVQATSNVATLAKWVHEGQGDLVLSDVYMGEANLFEVMPKMRDARRALPIIVMSAQSTVTTAFSAANAGAYDYLPKPFDLDDLLVLVRKALAGGPDPRARANLSRAEREERLPLIGRSPAMQEVFRTVARVAMLDLPILIVGEAGTGKQRVARTIHDHGKRAPEAFLQLRLAGASPQLLDQCLSELTTAQGGAIFLDDVDGLSPDAQRRLSSWLQAGDDQRHPRLIAATRRDLAAACQEGSFLPELYYRLSVVTIRLPPLRERHEDIADLSRALLVRAKRDGLPEKALDAEAVTLLEQYQFPGNVRELDNLLRRAAALSAGPLISARDLSGELRPPRTEISPDLGLEEAVSRWTAQALCAASDINNLYEQALSRMERPLIERTLEAARGNQIKAARMLGINRNTLRKKLQLLGLSTGRSD